MFGFVIPRVADPCRAPAAAVMASVMLYGKLSAARCTAALSPEARVRAVSAFSSLWLAAMVVAFMMPRREPPPTCLPYQYPLPGYAHPGYPYHQ